MKFKIFRWISIFLLIIPFSYGLTLDSLTVYGNNGQSITFDEPITMTDINLSKIEMRDADLGESFWTNETNYVSSSDIVWNYSNANINTSNFLEKFRFYDINNSQYVSDYDFGNFTSNVTQLNILFTYFTNNTEYNWTFVKPNYNNESVEFTFTYDAHNDIITNVISQLDLIPKATLWIGKDEEIYRVKFGSNSTPACLVVWDWVLNQYVYCKSENLTYSCSVTDCA